MTTPAVHLPARVRLPKIAQGLAFILFRRRAMERALRRYGPSFVAEVPLYGPALVITEPTLIKQLFQAPNDVVGNPQPNLGRVLGSGSMFNLEGADHLRRRKLLVPPFHGRRMHAYEQIVEEEVRKETATWPAGAEFRTLEPMMRVTLNIILRAVFGAEGAEFEELRELLPPFVSLSSRLTLIPYATTNLGRLSPGGRHAAYRRRFDRVVDSLAEKALADPRLDERGDVLSMMLQARYEDGAAMTRAHLRDELLTLLAAGHETTATTLAWTFERIRRHPTLLRRLQREVDEDGGELRRATILEVQRTRPVIEGTGRRVLADSYQLGEWVLPRGHIVIVAIALVHDSDDVFPNAKAFDPDRFVGTHPDNYSWVPFGGGTRRCIGAAFAAMEMDVTLRTVLREFDIGTTDRPEERSHSRGVAVAPADGGRVIVRRRRKLVDLVDDSARAGPEGGRGGSARD